MHTLEHQRYLGQRAHFRPAVSGSVCTLQNQQYLRSRAHFSTPAASGSVCTLQVKLCVSILSCAPSYLTLNCSSLWVSVQVSEPLELTVQKAE